MTDQFVVRLTCPSGTHRFVDAGNPYWEEVWHTITWAVYDTVAEALIVAADLMAGNYRVRATVGVYER